MFLKMNRLFPFLLCALFLTSCNEYQKVLKSEDTKVKYDAAETYYKAGDFKRANRLFEIIHPNYVGKPQGERVMFFLSDSYYKTKDYNTAGYQFERFIKSYPKSDKVQEAAFLGAKSYYHLSPKYSLDQTDTDKALLKLQNFINAYPNSEYLAEANILAKELTTKKEKKAFEIAKQFSKLGENYILDYSISAIAALDNFMIDFPGSKFREEALYRKVEATTNLAINSTQYRLQERIDNAKEAYQTLVKKFPETTFKKDADKLLEKVEKASINVIN